MTRVGQELISPETMRAQVLTATPSPPPRILVLEEVDGLVLAGSVTAPSDLPRFDNAAMDGFAIRSADTIDAPVRLQLVGGSMAGLPASLEIGSGQAVAIATGAVLPSGADSVLPLEDAEIVTGERPSVVVPAPVPPGRHIRVAGEDVRAGSVVLEAGTVLGPGQIAAMAAMGMAEANVYPRPRVSVVPTGDELRRPGEPLEEGQVYDAVSAPLAMLIREAGGRPILHPPIPDDADALLVRLQAAAASSDAIITVGGVSMGQRDVVRRVSGVRSFRLALRPAKPFAFGLVFGTPLFGLPGNPAAALAAFEELVRPAILAMMGRPPLPRPSVPATLAEPIALKPGLLHLIRAEVWREGGRLWARPAGDQRAGMIHSLARAGAWASIPPEVEELPAGAEVQIRLLVELP